MLLIKTERNFAEHFLTSPIVQLNLAIVQQNYIVDKKEKSLTFSKLYHKLQI